MNDPVAPLQEPPVPIGGRAVGRRPGWWIAPVYLVMAAVLVPWIVVLFQTLPERLVVANYRLPWIGFDVMLAVALVRTAWLAYRRSPFLVNVASVTAALLVVDAWFDITTAPSGRRLIEAIVAAVVVEVPLAVLSMVLAYRAQREIARTSAVRRYAWERWEHLHHRDDEHRRTPSSDGERVP